MTAVEPLTPAARKALKARAHALEPVVWIGEDGLTDAVVTQLAREPKAEDRERFVAGLASMSAGVTAARRASTS